MGLQLCVARAPSSLALPVLLELTSSSSPSSLSPNRSWIDLPKEHKMVEASYQERKAADISSAHPTPDTTIKVVCGEAHGSADEGVVKGNVRPLGGCWFLHFLMAKKGERVWQPVPAGWNAFVRPRLSSPSSSSLRQPDPPHRRARRSTPSRARRASGRPRPRRRHRAARSRRPSSSTTRPCSRTRTARRASGSRRRATTSALFSSPASRSTSRSCSTGPSS